MQHRSSSGKESLFQQVHVMMAAKLTVIVLLALAIVPVPACHTGSLCTTDQQTPGYCIHGACVGHIPAEVRDHLRFKIVVKYPESELRLHGLPEMMYIRGLDQASSWLTGGQMTKTQNDTWETEVTYTSSIDGFRCQMCTDMTPLKHNKLEYRIFLNNGVDMKGGNFMVDFPLSSVSSYFNQSPEINVYPWFFSDNGTVSGFDLWSMYIGGYRNITIFIPPSFMENTYKKYPVFISFDVTYDLAERTRYIFEDPINMGVASEYVFVSFADYNDSRNELLTPSTSRDWRCLHGKFDHCEGCIPYNLADEEYYKILKDKCGRVIMSVGMGDSTLDFMLHEVLPKAENQFDNRLLLDRDNLGIIGYSLGGLMACHAAWTRPSVFGLAACQSPSLWWPLNITDDLDTSYEFEFLNKTLKNPILWKNRPRQKIYMDVGGQERGIMEYGVVEAAKVIETHELFKENENMWVNVFTGDAHNVVPWLMRIWRPITTLLPMSGRPQKQDGNDHNLNGATSTNVPVRPTGIPVIPDIHVPNIVG